MFFEKRTQSSIKHRRLRYLLLFAPRALLVVLLVLAFAHPYVRQTVLASKRAGEVTVLAIDNSLSMRAGTDCRRLKRRRNRWSADCASGSARRCWHSDRACR